MSSLHRRTKEMAITVLRAWVPGSLGPAGISAIM